MLLRTGPLSRRSGAMARREGGTVPGPAVAVSCALQEGLPPSGVGFGREADLRLIAAAGATLATVLELIQTEPERIDTARVSGKRKVLQNHGQLRKLNPTQG